MENIKENMESSNVKELKNESQEISEKDKFKKVENQRVNKTYKKKEKEMNKHSKHKKPIIIISIIAFIILFISTIFSFININNEKILNGVSIAGIDVSGMTKEEANEKIQSIYNEKIEKEIDLKYEDYETTINPTLLEVKYDYETAVNDAVELGKKSNIFVNNYEILSTMFKKRNINVNLTLNEDVAKQTIEDIGVNLPDGLIESSYSVEGDKLIITKGKEGACIDAEKMLQEVKKCLNNIQSKADYIQIPVAQKEPTPIDIQKIHDEIYKEAQDAYYTKEPFTVYPEVEGIDFDVETAKKALEEDKEEYVIKLTITKPKVTLDQIGTEAFPDRLATFTTRYDVSDKNRTTNLEIACKKINDKVILSGETFSYNKTLGPRTEAAGYRNGKVYEGGEVVDGIGGGICQISSTLYNSVLMSNLEIVERRNHQFVTSYVPAGRDATVVYGLTDFKFKNTRKYPIRIVASAKNGIATVSIYGIKEENEYTFTFNTKTIATIPPTTKYEEDPTLPVGTEKVKRNGTNGLKTETYITKMLNGKAISTTLLSKDTYDAMTKIIIKGTKTETKTEEKNSEEEKTNTEINKNENNENNIGENIKNDEIQNEKTDTIIEENNKE